MGGDPYADTVTLSADVASLFLLVANSLHSQSCTDSFKIVGSVLMGTSVMPGAAGGEPSWKGFTWSIASSQMAEASFGEFSKICGSSELNGLRQSSLTEAEER